MVARDRIERARPGCRHGDFREEALLERIIRLFCLEKYQLEQLFQQIRVVKLV